VAYLRALDDAAAMHRITIRLRVAAAGRPGERFGTFDVRVGAEADGVLLALQADESTALREQLARAETRADSIDVAKGRFLAAVSHELRTPLNSIIGFSDMLLHGMAGPLADPRQEDYVGLIRDSG